MGYCIGPATYNQQQMRFELPLILVKANKFGRMLFDISMNDLTLMTRTDGLQKYFRPFIPRYSRQTTAHEGEKVFGIGFHKTGTTSLARALRHHARCNREVLVFFKDRPEYLLVFKLTANNEWKKSHKFLDKPVRNTHFPNQIFRSDCEKREELQSNIITRFVTKHTRLLNP